VFVQQIFRRLFKPSRATQQSGNNAALSLMALMLISAASLHAQTTIHVPADQPAIQAAINAASNGDTVLVSDGTYHENIDFKGKAITVTSINGARLTTIDGGALNTVVTFKTSEGANSVLNGFTITNGFSTSQAAGIYVTNASPTITNNIITANKGCQGIGVTVNFGGPLIQGNTVSSNTQSGCSGGSGGGVLVNGASSGTRIIGNVIANNSLPTGGGGISLFAAGAPVIQNNIITSNNGGNQGGGITIANDASPQIVDNLIILNSATQGGGLYWLTPQSTPGILLLNNTIAENSATTGSGVFASGFDANASIQNNIIVGVSGVNAVFCESFNNNTPPSFTANDAFTTGAAAYGGICPDQTGSNGNISSDPLFVDTTVSNLHLQPASPAIDQGNNTARIPLPATDLSGNNRIFNNIVDIGTFEFSGLTTATVTPTVLTFPAQFVGSSSSPMSMTVANTGSTALQISSITITGDFSQTSTCRTSSGIAAGQSCTISVTFSPVALGTRTGQLTITSNSTSSPQTVNLSGTGNGPIVSLSATSLNFPSQLEHTTSAPQQVTLTNVGDTALNISSILASGDFAQSNNCPATVAVGAGCTISVTFTPSARGNRTGTITINDNAGNSPQGISLSGTGAGPAASLTPSSLFFGLKLVGTTTAARTITLTSTGEAPLAISSISVSGDFAQTNNCPASLPIGQSCTIQVTFTPTVRGIRTGTVTITDNADNSPQNVSLLGKGIAPVASFTPASLAFGNQPVGVPATSTIALKNTGDAALSITSITTTGDFSQTNNCGASLAAGATCTITVTFTPTAVGARSGTLTVIDSAAGSPHTGPLSGTGV